MLTTRRFAPLVPTQTKALQRRTTSAIIHEGPSGAKLLRCLQDGRENLLLGRAEELLGEVAERVAVGLVGLLEEGDEVGLGYHRQPGNSVKRK